MVDWILFFAGIIFLIPMVIQFRLYLFIRSNSYLRFSLLFFFIFLDAMITSLQVEGFLAEILITLSFVTTQTFLIIIGLEMLNYETRLSRRGWVIIAIFIFTGTILLKYLILQKLLPQHYTSLRIIYGEMLELSAGYFIVKGFTNHSPIVKNDRTRNIRYIWLTSGSILIFNALLTIITEGLRFMIIEFNLFDLMQYSQYFEIINTIVQINILTISIMVMVSALFYPEILLLSMYQIYNTSKLYKLMNQSKERVNTTLGDDIILDYLDSLPPQFSKENSDNN